MTPSLAVLLAASGVALLSMAAYALLGARADADAAGKGAEFLGGLGNFLVHWFMWLLGPAERAALRLGATPDFFNFAGLALGLLSGVLIGTGRLELGGWAIALGGVADILDGRIARATKVTSGYGAFIDSTLDRFVEVFALLGFAVYLRGTPWGAPLAGAALAGSLLVSYARARGESVGVPGPKGLMQRGERLVLTFLACLADHPLTARLGVPPGTAVVWVLGFIAVTTFATAVHRTIGIALELRRKAGRG